MTTSQHELGSCQLSDRSGIDVAIDSVSRLERYHLLTQVIVPRPVAWVVSRAQSHDPTQVLWNLAPYSYFNIVSSEPPVIVLGFNSENHSQQAKDTIRNLREFAEFTISVPHVELADQVAATSAEFPPGTSEATACNVKLADWPNWSVPRVEQARVSLGCRLTQEVDLGSDSQVLAVAWIEQLWVDPQITVDVDGVSRIDVERLNPLARVGGGKFAQLGPPFKSTASPRLKRTEEL